MTKDEALKLALDALGEIEWSNDSKWQSDRAKAAIADLGALDHFANGGKAIKQPAQQCTGCEGNPSPQNNPCAVCGKPAQQEPFAWADAGDLSADTAFRWCETGNYKTPVYTSSPPKRQPLTKDEITELFYSSHERDFNWPVKFARVIEAKLKEKNT